MYRPANGIPALLALAATLVILAGCATLGPAGGGIVATSSGEPAGPSRGVPLLFPERLNQGYMLFLPGVWGGDGIDQGALCGLRQGEVPCAVEFFDWTRGAVHTVANLRDLERNRQQAQQLTARVVDYQERFPGRPVYLLGYSAGGAVAILTLEALPPGRSVTKTIVMGTTLAPDYDLRPALVHSEKGIVNFYSLLDSGVLGLAVSALGTSEGRHTVAAGAVGFKAPRGISPEEAQWYGSRITQYGYQFAMLKTGHAGGHFGWTEPNFVAAYVAPLVGTH